MSEHILHEAKKRQDIVLSANISNIRILIKSLVFNPDSSILKLVKERVNDIANRYNIK